MRSLISPCVTLRTIASAALLTAALASCGGGGDTPTPPAGSFSIAVSPTTASTIVGNFVTATVSIARTGSFAGTVAVRVDNTPAGVTASSVSVPAGSASSDLVISVAETTVPGTYPLTLVGSASGQAERSVVFTLTVTPRPGSFTMGLSPGAITVRQGLSGTTTVTIARVGSFTGAVSLSLEGAANGVTGVFTPASIPSGSTTATLVISATSAVTPGAAALTVRGTGAGVTDQTWALALTVTPDPGSFSIAVAPTTVSVEQRLSGNTAVSIARIAPFTGAVTLAIEGLPAGVTASLSPTVVAAGASTATLTLTVGAAVAVGNYPLTVRGTSNGVPDATAAFTLTVTLSPGGFTIATTPASVQQGQVGAFTLTVVRIAPFAGAIALSVEGAPSGVTATLSPAVIPADQTTAQLTYSVVATVPTAVYPIGIRGTGTGIPEQRITQNLTITAPPAGNVTFQFCNTAMQPVWVGYQDGGAQWTQVGGVGNSYNFPITADKGRVAFVMPVTSVGGAGFDIMLVLGTRAELVEAGNQSCGKMPPTKTLTGTLGSRGANDVVTVNIGTGYAQILPAQPALFGLLDAESGARDLFAVRTTFTSPLPPSMLIIRRSTNYPAGSAIPLLDFGSGEALATTLQTVTAGNGGGDQLLLKQAYVTSGGTTGLFPTTILTANPWAYMVVPPAAVVAGDIYNLRLEAHQVPSDPATRVVTSTFAAATAQTLTLGPMLTPPTLFNLQAAPFYQARVQTTLQPEYNNAYFARYRQPTRSGAFYATAAYIGGSAMDITTPDLTRVPGWRADWGPLAGVSTTVSASAFGWTGTSSTLFPGWFGDVVVEPGVTLRSAVRYDVMTP